MHRYGSFLQAKIRLASPADGQFRKKMIEIAAFWCGKMQRELFWCSCEEIENLWLIFHFVINALASGTYHAWWC